MWTTSPFITTYHRRSFLILKNINAKLPHFPFLTTLFPPINSFSSDHRHKDPNLVDDIRSSSLSSSSAKEHFHSVRPSQTTSSSSPKNDAHRSRDTSDATTDMASYSAEMAKQGTVKAMETGLNMGEMAKKTLDNVWDTTKDATHKIKEAVAGEREEKGYGQDNNVPPTDHFVDDLRNRADGYDLKNKRHES